MPICEGRDKKSDACGVAVETFPTTNVERDTRRQARKQPGAAYVPRSVPDQPFPRWPIGDGETGKIALNEWSLWGAPIANLNVRVWAELPGSAGR